MLDCGLLQSGRLAIVSAACKSATGSNVDFGPLQGDGHMGHTPQNVQKPQPIKASSPLSACWSLQSAAMRALRERASRCLHTRWSADSVTNTDQALTSGTGLLQAYSQRKAALQADIFVRENSRLVCYVQEA